MPHSPSTDRCVELKDYSRARTPAAHAAIVRCAARPSTTISGSIGNAFAHAHPPPTAAGACTVPGSGAAGRGYSSDSAGAGVAGPETVEESAVSKDPPVAVFMPLQPPSAKAGAEKAAKAAKVTHARRILRIESIPPCKSNKHRNCSNERLVISILREKLSDYKLIRAARGVRFLAGTGRPRRFRDRPGVAKAL